MPRAPTACGKPGCPNTATHHGRCPDHQRPAWRTRSPSSIALAGNSAHRRARRAAIKRAGGRCERCGRKPARPSDLELHHPDAIADGGPVEQPDAVLLCKTCHDQEP